MSRKNGKVLQDHYSLVAFKRFELIALNSKPLYFKIYLCWVLILWNSRTGQASKIKFRWVLKFVSNVKITTFFCFDVLHGTMKQPKQGFIIVWMLSIRNMHLFFGETGISDGHKLLRHDPHKSMLPYHETI